MEKDRGVKHVGVLLAWVGLVLLIANCASGATPTATATHGGLAGPSAVVASTNTVATPVLATTLPSPPVATQEPAVEIEATAFVKSEPTQTTSVPVTGSAATTVPAPTATPTPRPTFTETPRPTAVPLTHRDPTDQEIYQLLFLSRWGSDPDSAQSFTDLFPNGRWLRWDRDLDGNGEVEIIVAATDRENMIWFYLLQWNGQAYDVSLDLFEGSEYYADIRASFADVNNDGLEEVIVDFLTLGGGTGVITIRWDQKIVHCQKGQCGTIWEGAPMDVGSSFQPDIGSLSLGLRRCGPEFIDLDGDIDLELRLNCSGFGYDLVAPWREEYQYREPDQDGRYAFPRPFEADKEIEPATELVWDWNGETYEQYSYEELSVGQIISREYSARTAQATQFLGESIKESFYQSGIEPQGNEVLAAIERAWGIQAEDERLALAALGDVTPGSSPDLVGLIAGEDLELCRLVLSSVQDTPFYTPTQAITVACEIGFDRLETIDLNGDGQDEVLFNTLVVTNSQPFLHDSLSIFTWNSSGLEPLFEGTGFFPDENMRGVYAVDLDGDGLYEVIEEHPGFELGSSDPIPWDLAWPTLDRIYSVYRWDVETARYYFWQKRREPYGSPGEVEILEEATP